MAIFKKGILVLAFVCLAIKGYCLSANTPEVNFGTIHYLYEGSGNSQYTVVYDGAIESAGIGNLISQSGGTYGTVTFTFDGLDRLAALLNDFTLTIGDGTYPYQADCGRVTISNVHTTNRAQSATQSASITTRSISLPIGATLTVDSFTGTASCTISTTFSSAMTGKVGNSRTANASLKISVIIVPDMAVEHNSASLNFGRICTITTGQQTITVAPNGNVSSTNLFCPAQGTSPDSFTVTGNIGQSFNVSAIASTTISNGSDSLTVSNLTPSCSQNCVLTDHTYNLTVGGNI